MVDAGPDAVAQFQVAGDKIGVEMGEEDVADLEIVRRGVLQVAVDVALRIHDHSRAALRVAQQVGGVGQAAQIILFQDHGVLLYFDMGYSSS
jgi:hypothetical protein